MDISLLKFGILHSLIGKNDGVSIVIDQSVQTMVEDMRIPLGNIYYLAGHSPTKINTMLNDCFWHRNEENRYILANFSKEAPDGFDEFIMEHVLEAKKLIAKFVSKFKLDVFIIHNGCHPSNFVYAVAAGMYFDELRREGLMLPKYLLWWHDSHFERERFKAPNQVIRKYLQYIPGKNIDGVVFINSQQSNIAHQYLEKMGLNQVEVFEKRKTCVIPNTCDIPWDWQSVNATGTRLIPPLDQYNKTFYRDIGLLDALSQKGFELDDAIVLLQHTRVVERKRIDVAIDFMFLLESKIRRSGFKKCLTLLVSGHSGDEHDSYRQFIEDYFAKKCKTEPDAQVLLIFGEDMIFPGREVMVNKKYYAFGDVPSIVAQGQGMGTYFSEVEGYGNNLLEMLAMGLPVVINEYEIFRTDIEALGFRLVKTRDGVLTDAAVDEAFRLLTDPVYRRETIEHNLQVLTEKLHHGVMAQKLSYLIENLFKYN